MREQVRHGVFYYNRCIHNYRELLNSYIHNYVSTCNNALKTLMIARISHNSPPFIDPDISLQCSQQPRTGCFTETVKSTYHHLKPYCPGMATAYCALWLHASCMSVWFQQTAGMFCLHSVQASSSIHTSSYPPVTEGSFTERGAAKE